MPATAATGSPDIPGQLIATRVVVYDCVEPNCSDPAGYYRLTSAGPATRFRLWPRVGQKGSLATPVQPRISPDGRWIVFATTAEHLAVQRFDALRHQLVGRRRVLRLGALTHDGPPLAAWSPDSRSLVLAGTIHRMDGIWTVDRDGSNLRRIVCGCRMYIAANVGEMHTPAWSRTGQIAFVAERHSRPEVTVLSIFVVSSRGAGLRRVSDPRSAPVSDDLGEYIEDTAPAWSPDGRRLAFAHGRRSRSRRAARPQRDTPNAARAWPDRRLADVVA